MLEPAIDRRFWPEARFAGLEPIGFVPVSAIENSDLRNRTISLLCDAQHPIWAA
ncbi:hypothetical protein ACI5KX_03760 [Erythrobacter sp. GH1-10]|uniref:hypothetical protein n=1 Tax=Erythrobacter sp. GH1-10 TaxID=3349334 RepID=UPI0038782E84